MDIREVARRSGVSVATVSRALNGRPDVSAATRERVVEIARTLGYEPNQTARTLVRRRSDTVGVIWDTGYVRLGRRQPFLQDLLVGLKMALSDVGYHMLLLSTGELGAARSDGAAPASFVSAARQHSLDGVVLMGVDHHHPGVAALRESRFPCIGFDQALQGARATYVTSDNRAGAVDAVEHLWQHGHRRIATITGPLDLMPSLDRLAGYLDTMAAHGQSVPDEYVQSGDFFLASGFAAMQTLLRLPEPPTAVFVAGDEMAVGGLHAIAEAGLRCPDDVSLVGFDDLESALHVRPSLTSVAQDHLALGRAAVDALLRLINPVHNETVAGADAAGEELPPPVQVPTRLVVRESAAAPTVLG